jgi:uncharacterized protein (DUF1330 family)
MVSVYLITDITVHNQELYNQYVEKVKPLVERYGGRYLARGGEVTSLTDNWKPERVAIVGFESMGLLQECFSSEEYQAIAPLREQATMSRAIVVQGC